MKLEPYSDVRPDDHWFYTTIDEESPETEVMDLIKTLVNVIKPRVVVETGTALGYTAQEIGTVLNDIGRGKLWTIECDAEKVAAAKSRCGSLPVNVIQGMAREVNPYSFGDLIDILFIDGNLEERALELAHFWPALTVGGLAIVHDSLKFNPPRDSLKNFMAERIEIHSPRGLTIFQK